MKLTILLGLVSLASIALGSDNLKVTDPFFNKQWALKNNGQAIFKIISDLERERVEGFPGNDINWSDTSEMISTKKELIVAVLDSGMDIDHPDLKGRVWYNEKLCTNAPNAKILACNGFNFLDYNNNIADDMGHGTHVAGIIAAKRNTIGITGAADARIKIMPIKVMNSKVEKFIYEGKLITDVIADAMVFAIKNGAEVINLSLGWPKVIDTQKIRQAFQMAEDQNVMVIAASGNNSKDLPIFPCAYENVVCVGAMDNRGELTDFSNHGAKIDLVAPGDYILSTFPRNLESRVLRIANYEAKLGSSQAAPYVTAAVATLKLLNPGLTNDKVRSLLFRSSRPLAKSKDNHFIKFGSLDMKKLLSMAQEVEPKAFLNPQLKTITEIKYRLADRRFHFNLPLKNLSDMNYNGIVCVNSPSEAISLDQNCFEVKALSAHSAVTLSINGNLIDLSKDSHIMFTVQIDQHLFQTSLVFSRDLNNDSQLKTEAIAGGDFDSMVRVVNSERSLPRMIRVVDKFHRLNYPEYFYLDRSKQTKTSTVVSLLTYENGSYIVKTITLPLVNQVYSIHRQDINLDGEVDTFIYAISEKKDEYLFFNFDKSLKPLFGKYSKWNMANSTFGGPQVEPGIERFEWFKVNHPQLGAILVPSIYKAYIVPENDNSKNILDRVTTVGNHQYYLNPKLETVTDSMSIELRVIDSVAVMKKMRAKFNLYSDQILELLKPFPQTDEQSRNGEIHSLASVTEGDQKNYIEMILSADGIETKPLASVMALESAKIYPVVNSIDGEVMDESIFTSLLNRAGAEFLIKDHTGVLAPLVLRQDWKNPIIGLIGGFDTSGKKSFLLENRSTISFFSAEGHSELPVYRDSIFPGEYFSETLMPILLEGRPGVFINSTLIYGERLYSMIETEQGLIRPLRLSVVSPKDCVPLKAEPLEVKSSYNYTFLCADQNKQMSLKFLPMSEH